MYYETIFIVNPDVSQENTEQLTDELVERVEKAAGRIVKREYWGSRPLSYSIQKRKRGHYVLLVTDGEPAALEALEHAIRLEERIMRFLTTRLTELSDAPSPLARRKTPVVEESSDDTTDEAKSETSEGAAEAKSEASEDTAAEAKPEASEEAVAETKEATTSNEATA